jgi:hypothetical protein
MLQGSSTDGLLPIMHTRSLQETPGALFRNNIDFSLHVVFYNEDKSTMLDPDVISQVKAIEESIYNLPQYSRLCLHAVPLQEDGQYSCRRPISYTNVVYGRFDNSGKFIADGSADIQQDPVKAAQVHALPVCARVAHHGLFCVLSLQFLSCIVSK